MLIMSLLFTYKREAAGKIYKYCVKPEFRKLQPIIIKLVHFRSESGHCNW